MDNMIVSEMPLGPAGQTDFNIDAFWKQSNYAVSYEKNSNKFTWSKFDQQRQLHHLRDDSITQVCENFIV